MLRKCHNHGRARGREHDGVKVLFQGLNSESMGLINASTGGYIDNKTHDGVKVLFQRFTGNQRNWYNRRKAVEKKVTLLGRRSTSRMNTVEAQLANTSTQMESVAKAVASMQLSPQPLKALLVKCGVCQGGHYTDQFQMVECQEVEAVNFFGQGQGYNNQNNWRQQQGGWTQQGANPSSSNQWRQNSTPSGFEQRKPSIEDQMG